MFVCDCCKLWTSPDLAAEWVDGSKEVGKTCRPCVDERPKAVPKGLEKEVDEAHQRWLSYQDADGWVLPGLMGKLFDSSGVPILGHVTKMNLRTGEAHLFDPATRSTIIKSYSAPVRFEPLS